jgi:SagB-type dehydrogenase family enzyme
VADPADPIQLLLAYHAQTKHHFRAYARSLGYLDWETQPDPFRRYPGAPLTALPHAEVAALPTYAGLFEPPRMAAARLTLASLSRFLRHSLALSAWKQHGPSRWSLRINPSSGNLHPTEGYVLVGAMDGLAGGLHHYAPEPHALEQRAAIDPSLWRQLTSALPEGAFLVGLSTIPWREAWKYGERAFRYCQHDLGHALGALRLAAALCGWQATLLDDLDDDDVAALLGLDRVDEFVAGEPEFPEGLVMVHAGVPASASATLDETILAGWSTRPEVRWHGRPAPLSPDHVDWPIIDAAALLSRKPRTALRPPELEVPGGLPLRQRVPASDDGVAAERLLHRRRSAVDLDGRTGLSAAGFGRLLAAALPAQSPIPFDVGARSVLARPRVHLALFVHRVDGLSPGLYMLPRHPDARDPLRAAMHRSFRWERVTTPGLPELPLHLLEAGDVRALAAELNCGQEIASHGAFAVAMVAELEQSIRAHGAWMYRRLFWEAGLIGQVLYLEAEAAGLRATGIGCYFDDPVHEVLGLEGATFQSLYGFTVGAAVDDPRLTTRPPYPDEPPRV